MCTAVTYRLHVPSVLPAHAQVYAEECERRIGFSTNFGTPPTNGTEDKQTSYEQYTKLVFK